jgi:glycosyltransferase involved in cell wall biosynthesis
VTPSYNQAKYLEKTIKSVLNQDYSNLEYIVIDGGSTDESVDIIKKYTERLSYWESKKDKGQTEAINKGFSKAKGQIFAWINSDDTYQPGAISEMVQFMIENPDVGMVYGDCNFIDADDNIIGKFNAAQTNFRRLEKGYVHIPQQAAFWRSDLHRKVSPLDESIYFAMDYDLWLRLANITKIMYYPRLWANFRLHEDAKTIAEDDRCWPDMVRIHYRDGGKWYAPIIWKYWIRRLAGPYIRYKRRKMFNN